MPATQLSLAEPFFRVFHITDEPHWDVTGKVIVLNLADLPLAVENQCIDSLQSAVVCNTTLGNVQEAVIVQGLDNYTQERELFKAVRAQWPSAYEVRGEERLRGVEHYMSPKVWIGNLGLTFYHAGSVPLGVGLHQEHPFCDVAGYREVHTQIVGFGKMQQCLERDESSLYLEEPMAPGATHKPMYDEEGNYPWHQYETITPSIFMAVELLPEGAIPPSSKEGACSS